MTPVAHPGQLVPEGDLRQRLASLPLVTEPPGVLEGAAGVDRQQVEGLEILGDETERSAGAGEEHGREMSLDPDRAGDRRSEPGLLQAPRHRSLGQRAVGRDRVPLVANEADQTLGAVVGPGRVVTGEPPRVQQPVGVVVVVEHGERGDLEVQRRGGVDDALEHVIPLERGDRCRGARNRTQQGRAMVGFLASHAKFVDRPCDRFADEDADRDGDDRRHSRARIDLCSGHDRREVEERRDGSQPHRRSPWLRQPDPREEHDEVGGVVVR